MFLDEGIEDELMNSDVGDLDARDDIRLLQNRLYRNFCSIQCANLLVKFRCEA